MRIKWVWVHEQENVILGRENSMSKGNGCPWIFKKEQTSLNRVGGVFGEGEWQWDWEHSFLPRYWWVCKPCLKNVDSTLKVARNYQRFQTREWCDQVYVLERSFWQARLKKERRWEAESKQGLRAVTHDRWFKTWKRMAAVWNINLLNLRFPKYSDHKTLLSLYNVPRIHQDSVWGMLAQHLLIF